MSQARLVRGYANSVDASGAAVTDPLKLCTEMPSARHRRPGPADLLRAAYDVVDTDEASAGEVKAACEVITECSLTGDTRYGRELKG
jgi:hypothetical protein